MTWHKDGHRDKPDMIVHPSDAEGWKQFDEIHSEFASEPRNVRLGLSTDGFTPFNMTAAIFGCVSNNSRCSIFNYPGRPFGPYSIELNEKEIDAAHLYVLLNTPELEEYIDEYEDEVKRSIRGISDAALLKRREKHFAMWFRDLVTKGRNRMIPQNVRNLAHRPCPRVKAYKGYYCNGYQFHIRAHGENVSTSNWGICVKGSSWNNVEHDYYGIIEEIAELNYSFCLTNKIVLFKCHWFDNPSGLNVDMVHGLVGVKHTSSLRTYEPFVFAHQANQVYYMSYPSLNRERSDWWVATKTNRKLELPDTPIRMSVNNDPMSNPFQGEDQVGPSNVFDGDDEDVELNEEGVAEEVDVSELVVLEGEEREEIYDDDDDNDDDDNEQNELLDADSD